MIDRINSALFAAWGHHEEKDNAAEFFIRQALYKIVEEYPESDSRFRVIAALLDSAWYLSRLK